MRLPLPWRAQCMARELNRLLPDRLLGFCLLMRPDIRVCEVSGFVCSLWLFFWGSRTVAAKLNLLCGR